MRDRLAFFFLFVAYPAIGVSDTCVKIQSHTDEYYYGGRVIPAVDRTIELWFGDDKVAYVTDNRVFVLNAGDSILVFVNKEDSSYAETRLPLDWSTLVSQETLSFLTIHQRHGEIKETTETQQLGEWACTAYDVVSWIDVEDGRYDEREEKVWVSAAPPIDWKLYRRINRDALRLANYDDEFIEKLMKIDGFHMLVEAKVHIRGFSVNSREKVVEVEDKTPPAGLYTVPDGYRKKTELSLQDLRG